MKKIFIDGAVGTTGLKIYQRIKDREDLELLGLPEELRKDNNARKEMLNKADVVILCLPDVAAKEAVSMIENENTIVIDASTAHRCNDDFTYGFPEISSKIEEELSKAKRIAVPGCHASGVVALVYPLIEAGILTKEAMLTVTSITGYSGGGKSMIEEYEAKDRKDLLSGPRQYALTQTHKHLPEIKKLTGLVNSPIFMPIVADFYSGMEVSIPVFKAQLQPGFDVNDIKAIYKDKYQNNFVRYNECGDESGFLSAVKLANKDNMEISVHGQEERIVLVARYDNLGKGASGAAIECLNYVLGINKEEGLYL